MTISGTSSNPDREGVSYVPVLSDAAQLVRDRRFSLVLVVGERVFNGAESAGELRWLQRPEVTLPTGNYLFITHEGSSLMTVSYGASPGQPQGCSWDSPNNEPLILAYQWFRNWWDHASLVPSPRFGLADHVLLAPDKAEGVVKSREYEHDQWFYRVRSRGRTIDVRETDLLAPEPDDDPEVWILGAPDSASKLAAHITRTKLTEQLTDTVYSFRASRTVFRPYQFRPVLKLLESGHLRLLVADEVGLGKTIEAGLLWTELDARRQANRVLVVTPSGLVSKWKAEMSQRFGYELQELSTDDLNLMLERVELDKFPNRFHALVSVERLRIWSGLERLAEIGPRFDLVIVDEAHVFRNSGTRSHALGSLLSDWADALVFLSATPLNLGNNDLFNLLELLSPGDFDDRAVLEQRLEPNAILNRVGTSLLNREVSPATRVSLLDSISSTSFGLNIAQRSEFRELRRLLEDEVDSVSIVKARQILRRLHALDSVVTRTRKTEIQERRTVREPIQIDVQWVEREADFYNRFGAWQQARARKKGIPSGFATQMPMRLASTCLPAARDRVIELSKGQASVEILEDLEDDEELNSELLTDQDDIKPPADLVMAASRLGDVDSKFDVFLSHLLPIVGRGRKVLVFSFSRPTLAYLYERLHHHVRVQVMHGGVERNERTELIARFRRGDFDVMLASRVASEGLDFEFCSAVVNYDLPWNPMEIEQRIGRIDRFGQVEDKILVLNFHTPGTIESDIIERVHQRIGVFTSSIGELEPIVRESLKELKRTIFDFELSEEQRMKRLDASLAAIEEQKAVLEEVDRASGMLASTDQAEIEGLERDLLSTGRYVGQPELVLLLSAWISRSEEAKIFISPDGRTLQVIGSRDLEADLRMVQSEGDRSASEIDHLAAKLRNGVELHVSLDQEHARTSGLTLLTANHPLVRAAIVSGVAGLSRFASIELRDSGVRPGRYLCLISLARWRGIRSSNELWTCSIDLESNVEYPAVGDQLLAALADSKWHEGPSVGEVSADALRAAISGIRSKRVQQEHERREVNAGLVDIRRLSLEETFRRKRSVIERRIATARQNNSEVAVRLGESQLFMQDRLLAEARANLERGASISMEVEHLAVCLVEVRDE